MHFRESGGLARLCALLIFLRTVEPLHPSAAAPTAPPTAGADAGADANAGAARATLVALAAACENSHNAGAHYRPPCAGQCRSIGTGPHDARPMRTSARRWRGDGQREGGGAMRRSA